MRNRWVSCFEELSIVRLIFLSLIKMTYSDATVKYRRLTLGLIIEMYCIVGDNRSPWLRISGRWCEPHHFKSKAKPFLGERMLEIPIIEKFSKRPALFASERQAGDFSIRLCFAGVPTGHMTLSFSPSGHMFSSSNVEPLNVAAIQQVPSPSCHAFKTTCSKRNPAVRGRCLIVANAKHKRNQ